MSSDANIDQNRVDRALEQICELGCNQVREIIVNIERGVVPAAADKLNELECGVLLKELRAIMQTYE